MDKHYDFSDHLPSSPVPAPESHTSQAATFISEPNRSETMDASRNTACPCGNPIILDGIVVKAHWEGKVCQDCESEMFKKYEARFSRALGPLPSSPPADLTEAIDELEKAVVARVGSLHAETVERSIRSNIGWMNDERWNAARSALERIYNRQREEAEDAYQELQLTKERFIAQSDAEIASLSSQLERLTEENVERMEAEQASQTWDEGLAGEMIAQAELGNMRFCLGYHEHENGEVENEWIDWSDAFAKLRRRLSSDSDNG